MRRNLIESAERFARNPWVRTIATGVVAFSVVNLATDAKRVSADSPEALMSSTSTEMGSDVPFNSRLPLVTSPEGNEHSLSKELLGVDFMEYKIDWAKPVGDKYITTGKIRSNKDRSIKLLTSAPKPSDGATDLDIGKKWQKGEFETGPGHFENTPYEFFIFVPDMQFRSDANWQGGHGNECFTEAKAKFRVEKRGDSYGVKVKVLQKTGKLLYATSDLGKTWEEVPSGTPWKRPVLSRGNIDFFLEKTQNYARYCGGLSWGPVTPR